MDIFTKRVLRIPLENQFEEAYFTQRLWMFFRETKETEQYIHRIFDQIREKMKQKITLKKKSDPGKFAIPCLVKGFEFPCAMCDIGSSVSILPRVMSDLLGLKIEPSHDSFTFVDHSTRNSGGIIIVLEVQIGNALVLVDFHVLENKQNKNHSLLLGRTFMATVGAVCNMQTNQLCLTLISHDVHYDPVRVMRRRTSGTRVNTRFIAAYHCNYEDEYETEYS
uniref:Aspartic peptidase DDI1-type domain-containing protein n=1 Tax=Brassica campestris TaxID=3711 RepID=M4D130_BRACM